MMDGRSGAVRCFSLSFLRRGGVTGKESGWQVKKIDGIGKNVSEKRKSGWGVSWSRKNSLLSFCSRGKGKKNCVGAVEDDQRCSVVRCLGLMGVCRCWRYRIFCDKKINGVSENVVTKKKDIVAVGMKTVRLLGTDVVGSYW